MLPKSGEIRRSSFPQPANGLCNMPCTPGRACLSRFPRQILRATCATLVLTLCAFLSLSGWVKAEPPAPESADGTAAGDAPSDTQPAATGGEMFQLPDPVAKVNGEEIPAEQVRELALSNLPSPDVLGRIPPLQQRQLYARALDAIVADKLVSEASRVIKLEKSEIDQEIGKIAQQAGSAEELEARLKEEGRKMADLRQAVEASMRQERWLEPQVAAKAQISEQEVADFYKEEPRASQAPEVVRASHILLVTPPESTEEEVQETLGRIQEIRRRIVEGEPFEIMAKEHSEDPGSKDKGGDLSFFGRSQMVQEFEDAAFSLPVGDVSGPIKTQFGYHLIKVTEKKEGRTVPLEEASPSIVAYLQSAKRRQAVADIVAELREKAEIEIYLQ